MYHRRTVFNEIMKLADGNGGTSIKAISVELV